MKPTERFSNRADDYRRYRPGYPVAVIDLMRDACGLKTGAAVADIGSGTGIFTKLLLEGGFDVTAVEPNDPMRLAAEEDLRHFPRFHSVAAAAEHTGLPEAPFVAITVAQAFHWFDHQAARQEFQRLLRPDGWVFIIWNNRQIDTSPFVRDYESLLKTLGEPYEAAAHRDQDAGTRSLEVLFPAGSFQLAEFDNPHIMDWPGLRGRFLSASYVPAKDDPRHEEYLRRLEQIFHRHSANGQVTSDQKTKVYYGKLVEKS
jgi:SAM-dependent methyltransferase